ncbi:MAG: hypothetical protein IT320_03080 [Anaerolineae bacterium]|nr:hypothetical protein [Anaerolineae bacterium]
MAKRKEQDRRRDRRRADERTYFGPAYRDDIAHNQQGRMSPRQYARVVRWDYEMPYDEAQRLRAALKLERVRQPVLAVLHGALGFLLLAAALLFVLDDLGQLLMLLFCAVILLARAHFYYIPQPLSLTAQAQRFGEEKRLRRERMIYQSRTRKIIRVEGTPNYVTLNQMRVDGVMFDVDTWLYRWLSENSHHVAVYAIEGWSPEHALSVEPLDVPIPMTPEERLQTVVGVSSEGELVYADDPQQDDARRIENT